MSTLHQLTKVLLQFSTKKLYPLTNVAEIESKKNTKNSPFWFPKSSLPWEAARIKPNGTEYVLPRRATISSFGAGGNIGHLILEEYAPKNRVPHTLDRYFIPISSKTTVQLAKTVENFLRFFKEHVTIDSDWKLTYTLLNIMFTLCVGRVPQKKRVVFVTDTIETLLQQFDRFLCGQNDPNVVVKVNAKTAQPISEKTLPQIKEYVKNNEWHSLGELWVQGCDIPWYSFFDSYKVQRVSLPTYCFQKQLFSVPRPSTKIVESDAHYFRKYEPLQKQSQASIDDKFIPWEAISSIKPKRVKTAMNNPLIDNNTDDNKLKPRDSTFATMDEASFNEPIAKRRSSPMSSRISLLSKGQDQIGKTKEVKSTTSLLNIKSIKKQ